MPDLIVACLHLLGPEPARAALLRDPDGPMTFLADGVVAHPTADGGVDVVIGAPHIDEEWVSRLSARHPDVAITLGWEGESGTDLGWRRYVAGSLVAHEDLDRLAWHTPAEWATQGYEMYARVGFESLLEECDDRVMYPDA